MPLNESDNSLFQLLVLSFSNAALVGLGLLPSPETGKIARDLEAASYNIDILSMLAEKTQNNLSAGEAELLQGLLYDLRMKFIDGKSHS